MLRRISSLTSADNVGNTSSQIGVRNPGEAFRYEVWPYERIINNSYAHVNGEAKVVPVGNSDMAIMFCVYIHIVLIYFNISRKHRFIIEKFSCWNFAGCDLCHQIRTSECYTLGIIVQFKSCTIFMWYALWSYSRSIRSMELQSTSWSSFRARDIVCLFRLISSNNLSWRHCQCCTFTAIVYPDRERYCLLK